MGSARDRRGKEPRRRRAGDEAGLEETRPAAGAAFLARFELGERLGEGGMATVYRAFDRQLGRLVAVKALKQDGGRAAGVQRERLLREARSAARLRHPNIVAIHGVFEDEDEGRAYLILELVEGEPFDVAIRSRRMGLPEALGILAKVARAVEHAHGHGIVHRDLKPSNVLVDDRGEPRLVDFGLARLDDSTTVLTRTGAVLGTPYCMAPEQVRGDAPAIGPRTDVYALGVMLYQCLTGRRPFAARDPAALYHQILHEAPPLPRRLRTRLDPGLEALALSALEKDPALRCPSAAAFAEDLERHLDGRSIRSRPAGTLARVRRRWRTAAAGIAALATGAAALAIGFGSGLFDPAPRLEAPAPAPEPPPGAGDEEVARARSRLEALRLLERGRPALEDAYATLHDERADYGELVRKVGLAQPLFEEAIALDPGLPLAHHLLGRSWWIQGWEEKAEACWREAIRIDPGFALAHFELGRLLQARAFLMTAITTPEEVEARYAAGKELVAEARREFEAALATGFADEVQRDLVEVLVAYIGGDKARAASLAAAAIERYEGRDGVEEFHWILAIAGGEEDRIPSLDRAIAIRPKFFLALFCRAILRGDLGDRPGALADYEAAIRIRPRFHVAYISRAASRIQDRDLEGAERDLAEAMRIRPDDGDAYLLRAVVAWQRDDLESALADLDVSIRLKPANPIAWLDRGSIRKALGDAAGAVADYSEAIERAPEWATAHAQRGKAHEVLGDPDGALRDYSEALRLRPDLIEPRYLRGLLLAEAGRLDAAIADFDQAIRLDPRHADALADRGLAWQMKGDPARARADYDAAIEVDPGHADARFSRGNLFLERREIDRALADYDAAIATDPEYLEAYLNRAVARYARGDLDGTIADFETALRLAPPDWGNRRHAEELLRQARAAKLEDS